MGFGWEGDSIRLVPLDGERHLDNAVAWMNDEKVTHNLLHGDFPMTRLAELQWFEKMSAPNDTDVVFAIEKLDGEHIGFTGMHAINWHHRLATTGTVIGRVDLWGQGFGKESVRVRSRYAFEVLGLETLLSTVYEGNTASLRMLLGAGFKEIGRVPALYWKRGRRVDVTQVYCKREDWVAAGGNPQ